MRSWFCFGFGNTHFTYLKHILVIPSIGRQGVFKKSMMHIVFEINDCISGDNVNTTVTAVAVAMVSDEGSWLLSRRVILMMVTMMTMVTTAICELAVAGGMGSWEGS